MIERYYNSLGSIANDIPVLQSASTILECTAWDLYGVLAMRRQWYKKIWNRDSIDWYYFYKKDDRGKERIVTEPTLPLKLLQNKILENIRAILDHKQHTFVWLEKYGVYYSDEDKEIVWTTLAEWPYTKINQHLQHTPNPYFINIDIKSAYESTHEDKIYTTLHNFLQYGSKQHMSSVLKNLSTIQIQKVTSILCELVTFDKHLALGASTSPFLFHTIMKHSDRNIRDTLALLPLKNTIYTRYCDDMHISFEHIETSTISDIETFKKRLETYYSIFSNEIIYETHLLWFTDYLTSLVAFLQNENPNLADEYSKQYTRKIIWEIRIQLQSISVLIPSLAEKTYSRMPDNKDKKGCIRMQHEIITLQWISSENIVKLIWLLDQYKRKIDKVSYKEEYTKESIRDRICSVLEAEWRPVQKEKTAIYSPHTATTKKILGVWITPDKKITIPKKKVIDKVSYYNSIISWVIKTPKKYSKWDWTIDYKKIQASVLWYIQYMREIQWVTEVFWILTPWWKSKEMRKILQKCNQMIWDET